MNTQIIEGNKLIALFMGWEDVGNNYYKAPSPNFLFDQYRVDALKYNCDWSWIMSVVEKIESSNFFVDINGKSCCIYDINFRNTAQGMSITRDGEGKIDAIWTAVINFIQLTNLFECSK